MSGPHPGMRPDPKLVLVRPLVEGGMGSVWVADHAGLQSKVAVKFLGAHLVDNEAARKRFAREAAAAMQVDSPHVVKMLDYGISDAGLPYLVMELLQGHDLELHIARHGRLPPQEVLSIVAQIARGLKRAHDRGIIHRDVKPANVFLCAGDFSGDVFVKLLDFGVAKNVEKVTAQLTEQGKVVGTPRYMSPEQMMGLEVDCRTDLWSLGVITFEMLTGLAPFSGESLKEIAESIHARPLPLPSQVQPDLPTTVDAWFARACARARDDRFPDARTMVDELQVALSARWDEGGTFRPSLFDEGALPLAVRRQHDPVAPTVAESPAVVPRSGARRAYVAAGVLVLVLAGAAALWLKIR